MTQPIQKAGSISCGAVWAVWSNADVKAGIFSCRPLMCARNTFFRLCRGMWLFHIHSTVDIQLFFSFPRTYSLFFQRSPWRNFWLRHFSGYSFETSREKHQPFSMIQPKAKYIFRPCRHFAYNYFKLLKTIFCNLKNSYMVSID